MMQSQLKINFLISAALAITTVFLLYGNELGRRLGNYLLVYSVIWVLLVIGLLFLAFKLVGSPTALRVIVMGVVIGYFSGVLAHIFAVFLDVSNIRAVSPPISFDALIVPFIFPFLLLKGWVFSLFFILFAFLLNRYNPGLAK